MGRVKWRKLSKQDSNVRRKSWYCDALFGVTDNMGDATIRWESPHDLKARISRVYVNVLEQTIGANYNIFFYKNLTHIEMLGAASVQLDPKVPRNELEAIEEVRKIPGLDFLPVQNSILGVELHDDPDQRGAVKFDICPTESLTGFKYRGVTGVVGTFQTDYADGTVTNRAFIVLPKSQDTAEVGVDHVLPLFTEVQDAIRRVSRIHRKIQIYGGESIPLPKTSWTSWDNLFLEESVVKAVRDDLMFFLANEKMFREVGLPYKRGYLLCGAPGNGKSSIARAIATSMPFSAHAFDFSDENLGNSSLTDAFASAVKQAPAVFFLEDIDRLYDPNSTQKANVTLDHLLNCLDGIAVNDGLVVVATANNPKNLDPAILKRPGRFDKVVEINDPNPTLRHRYLSHLFRMTNVSPETISQMVQATEGVSMAFLKEIFMTAAVAGMSPEGMNVTPEVVQTAIDSVIKQYGGISKSSGRKAGFGS